MRYRMIRIVSLFLALSLCVCSVLAHSGKTDGKGGHYDNTNGEYHYHHGYPAHQHTDGVCPYDFDDKTNHDSSGSSTPPSTTTAEKNESTGGLSVWVVLLLIFLLPIFALAAWAIFCIVKRRIIRAYKRRRFLAKYGGLSLDDIAPPPSHRDYIGKDCLPHRVGYLGRDDYTVYVAATGRVYHANPHCGSTHGTPENIANCRSLRPCAHCVCDAPPDLEWYYKQKALIDESIALFGYSIFGEVSVLISPILPAADRSAAQSASHDTDEACKRPPSSS